MALKTNLVVVKMSDAEHAAVLELARLTGRTKSDAIRYAVETTRRALLAVRNSKVKTR